MSANRAEAVDHESPVIDRFLSFIANDLEQRPEAVVALSPQLVTRISALTEGVTVNVDDPLEGDVEL